MISKESIRKWEIAIITLTLLFVTGTAIWFANDYYWGGEDRIAQNAHLQEEIMDAREELHVLQKEKEALRDIADSLISEGSHVCIYEVAVRDKVRNSLSIFTDVVLRFPVCHSYCDSLQIGQPLPSRYIKKNSKRKNLTITDVRR